MREYGKVVSRLFDKDGGVYRIVVATGCSVEADRLAFV